MANLGPLAAEIGPVVWGTPANFNGFRILAALLHGTLAVGVGQTLRHWTEGATYIRLGICPHSSLLIFGTMCIVSFSTLYASVLWYSCLCIRLYEVLSENHTRGLCIFTGRCLVLMRTMRVWWSRWLSVPAPQPSASMPLNSSQRPSSTSSLNISVSNDYRFFPSHTHISTPCGPRGYKNRHSPFDGWSSYRLPNPKFNFLHFWCYSIFWWY